MRYAAIGAAILVILVGSGYFITDAIRRAEPGSKIIGMLETYESKTLGVQIGHPKGWDAQEEGGSLYFVSPKENSADAMRENVNLIVETLPERQKLDDYTKNVLTEVADLKGYKLLSSRSRRLGALAGFGITYSATIQNHDLRFEQVWALKDKKAYILTIAASPETMPQYARVFARMLKSFKLLPAPATP